jgi:hypothetical protein
MLMAKNIAKLLKINNFPCQFSLLARCALQSTEATRQKKPEKAKDEG